MHRKTSSQEQFKNYISLNHSQKKKVIQTYKAPETFNINSNDFPSLTEVSGCSVKQYGGSYGSSYSNKLKSSSQDKSQGNAMLTNNDSLKDKNGKISKSSNVHQKLNEWTHTLPQKGTDKARDENSIKFTQKHTLQSKSNGSRIQAASCNSNQSLIQNFHQSHEKNIKIAKTKNHSDQKTDAIAQINDKIKEKCPKMKNNDASQAVKESISNANSKNKEPGVATSQRQTLPSTSKKKRKSKIKRLADLQTGKIQVLSSELHSTFFRQPDSTTKFAEMDAADINDTEEYPELGMSTSYKSLKKNPQKKKDRISSSEAPETTPEAQDILPENSIQSGDKSDIKKKENEADSKKNLNTSTAHCSLPIQLSLFEICRPMKPKQKEVIAKQNESSNVSTKKSALKVTEKCSAQSINPLDSSRPTVKRGKEREKPRPKKPSALKKIILMDRLARKQNKLLLSEMQNKDIIEGGESFDQLKTNHLDHINKENTVFEDAIGNPADGADFINGSSCLNDPYLPENNSSPISFSLNRNNTISDTLISDSMCANVEKTDHVSDSDLSEAEKSACHFVCNAENFSINTSHQLKSCEQGTGSNQPMINTCTESPHDVPCEQDDSINNNHPKSLTDNENAIIILTHATKDDINGNRPPIVSHSNPMQIQSQITSKSYNSKNSIDDDERRNDIGSNCDKLSSELKSLLKFEEDLPSEKRMKAVKILLHTNKFRSYCDHFTSKDIDIAVASLLSDLVRFQDRLHQKNPLKAKVKRRLIYGIKEINKHMKLKKLKCVIIATDIENVTAEGGLNDLLKDLKYLADTNSIPCVFSHQKGLLGKLCHKPVPVSCVGVFNYEGSEKNFKIMMELQNQSKHDYVELVQALVDKVSDHQVQALIRAQSEAPESLAELRISVLKEHVLQDNAENSFLGNPEVSDKNVVPNCYSIVKL